MCSVVYHIHSMRWIAAVCIVIYIVPRYTGGGLAQRTDQEVVLWCECPLPGQCGPTRPGEAMGALVPRQVQVGTLARM